MEKKGLHTLDSGHTACKRYGERSWESVDMISQFRVVSVVLIIVTILPALNGVP